MFELGEKVVCIKSFPDADNGPGANEIVTIEEFDNSQPDGNLYFVLSEFTFDTDGYKQSFISCGFRKLDRQFTADLIESLCKSQEKENLITI